MITSERFFGYGRERKSIAQRRLVLILGPGKKQRVKFPVPCTSAVDDIELILWLPKFPARQILGGFSQDEDTSKRFIVRSDHETVCFQVSAQKRYRSYSCQTIAVNYS